jgi:hypothetical protein
MELRIGIVKLNFGYAFITKFRDLVLKFILFLISLWHIWFTKKGMDC